MPCFDVEALWWSLLFIGLYECSSRRVYFERNIWIQTLIWALDYDLNSENLNLEINTDVYLRIFNKHYKRNRLSINAAVLQGHVHTADKYSLLNQYFLRVFESKYLNVVLEICFHKIYLKLRILFWRMRSKKIHIQEKPLARNLQETVNSWTCFVLFRNSIWNILLLFSGLCCLAFTIVG